MDLDRFLELTYGFEEEPWLRAREWVTHSLRQTSHAHQTTSYGDLCNALQTATGVSLEPHGSPLAAMLGQINVIEHDAGRPLLSAAVLLKETGKPGTGFWSIAREMKMSFSDLDAFWLDSLNECYSYWSKRTP